MRNPGSRELRRRQARLETQQRTMVRERAQVPKRSEVMQRGGMLEGFAPSLVTRVALASLLFSVVLIALAVLGLLVELGQKDPFLGVVVVVVAVLISGVTMSVTAPAWLTASDRNELSWSAWANPKAGSMRQPSRGAQRGAG